jgi:metallo-beta-lactamase class B
MFVSLLAAAALAATGPAELSEWHSACDGKDGFSDPAPPLHIYGNVYDVGTCEITSLLITSRKGHILLDAATEEAAPAIAANIERLGFKLSDIKLIGISHEHYDHVGGIAELQRRTGATLMSMPPAYLALQTGQVEKRDPQYGVLRPFPAANVGMMLANGFVVGGTLTVFAIPILLMMRALGGGPDRIVGKAGRYGACAPLAMPESVGAAGERGAVLP